MSLPAWLDLVSLALLAASAALVLLRAVRGPSVFDRLAAAEAFALVLIGYLLLQARDLEARWFLDSALALALVSFVATVVCALFLARGEVQDD